MSYREYQQVMDIGIRAKPTRNTKTNLTKVTKKQLIRKRTKTGCLTCRRRKKKCDENVVDGKCQGCARNFLECCWDHPRSNSVSSQSGSSSESEMPTSPLQDARTRCLIAALLLHDDEESSSTDEQVSPLASPRLRTTEPAGEVNYLLLEPRQGIIQGETSAQLQLQLLKFIVTTFNVANNVFHLAT